MKKPLLQLLLLACALSLGAEEGTLYFDAADTKAIAAKEGEKVVVHGFVAASDKSASGTNFVNFKGAEFSLVTFKSDLGQFPDGEPADLYEGKRLAVEGAVAVYRGKPQIKLTDPAQVTVLEPDAVFPPPAQKTEETVVAPEPTEEQAATATEPAPSEEVKRKPPVDPSEYFKTNQ